MVVTVEFMALRVWCSGKASVGGAVRKQSSSPAGGWLCVLPTVMCVGVDCDVCAPHTSLTHALQRALHLAGIIIIIVYNANPVVYCRRILTTPRPTFIGVARMRWDFSSLLLLPTTLKSSTWPSTRSWLHSAGRSPPAIRKGKRW